MKLGVSPEFRWPVAPPQGYIYVSVSQLRKVMRLLDDSGCSACAAARVQMKRVVKWGKEAR